MTTIHEQAAEKVELAKAYAEDGAFSSAARIYREIAAMYETRNNEIMAELYGEGPLPREVEIELGMDPHN